MTTTATTATFLGQPTVATTITGAVSTTSGTALFSTVAASSNTLSTLYANTSISTGIANNNWTIQGAKYPGTFVTPPLTGVYSNPKLILNYLTPTLSFKPTELVRLINLATGETLYWSNTTQISKLEYAISPDYTCMPHRLSLKFDVDLSILPSLTNTYGNGNIDPSLVPVELNKAMGGFDMLAKVVKATTAFLLRIPETQLEWMDHYEQL